MEMVPARRRVSLKVLAPALLVAAVAAQGCDIVTAELRHTETAEWRKTYDFQPGGRVEIVNVNGKIEVLDEELVEGMVVTILTPEDRGVFTLGPEAEAELLSSIEEAERGEVISGEELLRELRRT